MEKITNGKYLRALKIVEEYLEQQKRLILTEKDKFVNQGVSVRLYNCLKYQVDDIQEITVEEFFTRYSEQNMLRWKNLGKKSLQELKDVAKKYNLKVKPY